MANKKTQSNDEQPSVPGGTALREEPFEAARGLLPFVHPDTDGSLRFWPGIVPSAAEPSAQQRVEGELWAIELLRYYRLFGHEPRARLLPGLVRHGVDAAVSGDEHFTGFLRILDAMLAFAARQCDLEGYAANLDAEHQRTLAAWAALGGD